MLKRLFLFIVMLLIVTVAACSSDDNQSTDTKETAEKIDSEDNEESEEVSVDKGLLNVEVTLPETFFEGDNMEEVIEKAKEEGAKEVTDNEDGTVTFKMSKKDHKKVMEDLHKDVEESLNEIAAEADFESVKDITYNKDFTDITLTVDKEAYESSFDSFAVFGVGLSSTFYHMFDGKDMEEIEVLLHIENEETKEVFEEIVIPEDLEELGKSEGTDDTVETENE